MNGNQHIRNFDFNGHNLADFGLVLNYFRVSLPSKRKIKEPLPNTNRMLYFSGINEGQNYDEREIDVKVTLPYHHLRSHQDLWSLWTSINTWLMGAYDKSKLSYSMMPKYYFLGEVEDGPSWSEFEHQGSLTFKFVCDPFRKAELREGHDIWDYFDFNNDVAQDTEFNFKSYWTNFKTLNVGDYATYGAWATQYWTKDLSNNRTINKSFLGNSYKIVDKTTVSHSKSRFAYLLEGHDMWLLEQDVLQAQTEYLERPIINNGLAEVMPIVTTNQSVTIIKDDQVFNFLPGQYQDELFMFKTGVNHIKMYIANVTLNIDFEFYKEVI